MFQVPMFRAIYIMKPLDKIEVIKGDITRQEVDAVVNAANSSLLGGGGVDGAIHRAGGRAILEECRKIRARRGSLPTGEAEVTTAGNMPAKKVIHTVGPVWQGGGNGEPQLLANCYRNSLQLALENDLFVIAFPNISTGIYRYPKTAACRIALQSVLDFLAREEKIEKVIFVCFDEENYLLYQTYLLQF